MSDAQTNPRPDGEKKLTVSWPPAYAILIVVSVFLVGQAVAAIIINSLFLSSASGSLGDNLHQFLFVALAEILTLGGLYAVLRSKKQGVGFIGLVQPKWRDAMYAVVGYGAYFVLYALVLVIATQFAPSLNVRQKQDIGFNRTTGLGQLLLVFIPLVILAPLAEEALVRGFLFRNLRFRMGFVWATVIASLLFGAAHLSGGEQGASLLWIAAIDTFSLSLVLCYLREKTGRLWASIGLHAIKNCVAFVILFVVAK